MVEGKEKGQNCCSRFGAISACSESSQHCDLLRSSLKKGQHETGDLEG